MAKNNIAAPMMKLEKFLSAALLVPMPPHQPSDPNCIWGLPIMLHGSPGVGKTARVHQAARAVGLHCKTVELGGRQPEDASGAPFLTSDNKLMIACILGAVNELNALGEGVLFLDELTCARPATQGAFLSMVQERRIGDVSFSKKIRVVCAGNPPSEAAGGYQLQPPMANRMAHRSVRHPTKDELLLYMTYRSPQESEPIHNGESRIVQGWGTHWAKIFGLYSGFMERFQEKYVFDMPKIGNEDRHRAYPTPRTNDMAMHAVTTASILGFDQSEQAEILSACMGEAAAVDWSTWVAEADLPAPQEVLAGGWKPDRTRLDKTVAVYTSLAAYVVGRPSKEEKLALAPKAWQALTLLEQAGMLDLALVPASTLVRGGLGRNITKAIDDASRSIMLRFHETGMDKQIER